MGKKPPSRPRPGGRGRDGGLLAFVLVRGGLGFSEATGLSGVATQGGDACFLGLRKTGEPPSR
jgi:hypothetical protein